MNDSNHNRPSRAGILLACGLSLLLLLGGCASTAGLAEEWAKRVEAGEYGWIDFNTGETKNLDSYPRERIEFLQNTLYPEYSQRCLTELRDYTGEVAVEIRFLLGPEGRAEQFVMVSERARTCGRDVIEALSSFSFDPARRDGQAVRAVGVYTHTLSSQRDY